MIALKSLTFLALLSVAVNAFRPTMRVNKVAPVRSGARNLQCMWGMSNIAGALVAASISFTNFQDLPLNSFTSFPVAAVETRQGMYKEYSVETDTSNPLDSAPRTYKTAEETEESSNKYWAIVGVLLAGSFIIPMVQYYWYVAEED